MSKGVPKGKTKAPWGDVELSPRWRKAVDELTKLHDVLAAGEPVENHFRVDVVTPDPAFSELLAGLRLERERLGSSSYLVEIRPDSAGRFTAQLVGAADLQVTAPTREETVKRLRTLILERLDSGSLQWIEVPRENPLMRWFGHAKDDPAFPGYLEEIRKFREEMDRRDNSGSDQAECSDTSLTPTM